MSSCFGENIRVQIFGQSHGPAIGLVIDGLPAGFTPDFDEINAFMARRAPGNSPLSTPRKEADQFEVLSGMVEGRLCGAPFAAIIRNTSMRSGDYAAQKTIPRPGHADFTAHVRYQGQEDSSGGGHFSGRLTAPLCLAGAICLQLLRREGVEIGAHILQIGNAQDRRFSLHAPELAQVHTGLLPVLRKEAAEEMEAEILSAREDGDSIGGCIEAAICGYPAGIGEPMFGGVENRLSSMLFGIPGIRGVEFGDGFSCAGMRGSDHNDPFVFEDDRIRTTTNHHAGILGGTSSGMPIVFRVAIKPTPSIARPQQSVDFASKEPVTLQVRGRHDPCIVPRAVPVVEAAAAIALYDLLRAPR